MLLIAQPRSAIAAERPRTPVGENRALGAALFERPMSFTEHHRTSRTEMDQIYPSAFLDTRRSYFTVAHYAHGHSQSFMRGDPSHNDGSREREEGVVLWEAAH